MLSFQICTGDSVILLTIQNILHIGYKCKILIFLQKKYYIFLIHQHLFQGNLKKHQGFLESIYYIF